MSPHPFPLPRDGVAEAETVYPDWLNEYAASREHMYGVPFDKAKFYAAVQESRRPYVRLTDDEFDTAHERNEGWSLERRDEQ